MVMGALRLPRHLPMYVAVGNGGTSSAGCLCISTLQALQSSSSWSAKVAAT